MTGYAITWNRSFSVFQAVIDQRGQVNITGGDGGLAQGQVRGRNDRRPPRTGGPQQEVRDDMKMIHN